MLHLAVATTDPTWATRAAAALPVVLLDHAHCEKKAASTAVNLIFRYPDRPQLMMPLSRLAREELAHFEEVLEQLAARGIPFGRQRPSPYAGKLMSCLREKEPARLLDTLLCCAFIEARSCERMKLLAEALTDPELIKLYKGLLAAEARHHQLYLELALTVAPEAEVEARLAEIGAHEGRIIAEGPTEPRLHNA